MSEIFSKSPEPTSKDSANATSSPGSAAGRSRSASPVGQGEFLSGREAVLASPSPSPGNRKAKPTPGISGPKCSGSSASAGLQRSLESRLQARLGMDGLMEFSQTWKRKATPAGRSYWAHTASARRTSGSGFSGWPTPKANEKEQSPEAHAKGFISLMEAAVLAPWPTPNAIPEGRGGLQSSPEKALERKTQGHQLNLDDAACLASESEEILGAIPSSSPAETGKQGAPRLNPAFSLWLQGFPVAEWLWCAPERKPTERERKTREESAASAS